MEQMGEHAVGRKWVKTQDLSGYYLVKRLSYMASMVGCRCHLRKEVWDQSLCDYK